MDILDVPVSYAREARRFFGAPRAFIREFEPQGTDQAKKSVKFIGFAFALTSAFVLVELRLIPKEMAGSLASAIKKDELIVSYWVLILVFAISIHVACRLLSGQGTLRASLVGIFRTYSLLVPFTTFVLIVSSQLVSFVLSTYWLVIPPLGVQGFEPFAATTTNLLLVAGFITVYFHLVLFFLLCTVWTLHDTHHISYRRTCIATAAGVGALFLMQRFVIGAVRKAYELFEPLLSPFL